MTVLICIDGYGQREPDPARTKHLRKLNSAHQAWIMLKPSLKALSPDYVRSTERQPDLTPVKKLTRSAITAAHARRSKEAARWRRGMARAAELAAANAPPPPLNLSHSEVVKQVWVRRKAREAARDASLALAA